MKCKPAILERIYCFVFGRGAKRDPHLRSSHEMIDAFKAWGAYDSKYSGKPRILMTAGLGYGNVGDEAQCGACIARWRRLVPDCKITIFSPNPGYTEALHHEKSEWAPRVAWFKANTGGSYFKSDDVFAKDFWKLRRRLLFTAIMIRRGIPLLWCVPREVRILQVLQNHDVLHISGGGFLTGKTRSRLWENCLLMRLCQILDVPYMLTGHNIGVFQDKADRDLAYEGLRAAKYVGLRDRGISEAELNSIGIQGPHIVSTCDDALLCPRASSEEIEALIEQLGADPQQAWVAVNFHHWGQQESEKEKIETRFAALADHWATTYKLQVLFISMTPSDVQPNQAIVARMQTPAFLIPYSSDYRVVRGVIGDAQICFTMKHHPIVFAQGECVPVVSVALDEYYLHKNSGAMENSGHGKYVLDKETFFSSAAEAKFAEFYAHLAKISVEQRESLDAFKALELVPYKRILTLLFPELVVENQEDGL
ncbi:polysaccharide pyruvyl transferase family protein [Kiritimatiellota bacterium B12222]|nr:polysaccharide pyruvyl transferase family protein [Kiritimatiellota bacterium B12222]